MRTKALHLYLLTLLISVYVLTLHTYVMFFIQIQRELYELHTEFLLSFNPFIETYLHIGKQFENRDILKHLNI